MAEYRKKADAIAACDAHPVHATVTKACTSETLHDNGKRAALETIQRIKAPCVRDSVVSILPNSRHSAATCRQIEGKRPNMSISEVLLREATRTGYAAGVAAERERCAKIAETTETKETHDATILVDLIRYRTKIAAAIRNQET